MNTDIITKIRSVIDAYRWYNNGLGLSVIQALADRLAAIGVVDGDFVAGAIPTLDTQE